MYPGNTRVDTRVDTLLNAPLVKHLFPLHIRIDVSAARWNGARGLAQTNAMRQTLGDEVSKGEARITIHSRIEAMCCEPVVAPLPVAPCERH